MSRRSQTDGSAGLGSVFFVGAHHVQVLPTSGNDLLLIAGICARTRMVFAFAVNNGAEAAIRSYSIANQISATASPVALAAIALCEVTAHRALTTVQLRGCRLTVQRLAARPVIGARA